MTEPAPAIVPNRPGAPEGAAADASRPRPGDELVLDVQSLAFGGEGVARVGERGYVVFVAGAVPGDRVRALVYKRKRSHAHARALEILEPSPERVPPRASHPGVAWQVLPYERQLQIKREQVDEALRRLGHLDGFQLADTMPAEQRWRYRNKLEYSFAMRPREGVAAADTANEGAADSHTAGEGVADAGPAPELICGFHAAAGARAVVALDDCLLASERGNDARELVLRWCREQGLEAWDRGPLRGRERPGAHARGEGSQGDADRDRHDRPVSRDGGANGVANGTRDPRAEREQRSAPAADGRARLRNVVVREGRRSGELQVRVVTTEGELDAAGLAQSLSAALGEQLSGVLWTRTTSLAETTSGGATELVWGEPQLQERICDLDVRISAEAFFQTNTEMAERLYAHVAAFAGLQGWERVYDLYCGIGTIAMALAQRAGEVWGIELLERAVADAIEGARRNEITNVRFFAGDVRTALPELLAKAGRPDVLVVDPPRAGLSKAVVRRIVEAAPRRIVYVSCNPTTLAPNAAELADAGWALRRVQPVDMFPHTHHIECVAELVRG